MQYVFTSPPDSFNPTSTVVACFYQHQNEILLLKRKNNKSFGNMWGLPAGKVNKGESVHDATIRELNEESGIKITNPRLLDTFYVRHHQSDFIYHLFHTETTEKQSVILSNTEHTEHQWISPWHTAHLNMVPGTTENIDYFYRDNYHLKYWTHNDLLTLEKVTSFSKMGDIGIEILQKMPKPIVQICGPVSTGKTGSIEQNIQRLQQAAVYLESRGYYVFRQGIFEAKISELIKKYHSQKTYCKDTLEIFYRKLFVSRLINSFYFLPGYEDSIGSLWEEDFAKRSGYISRYYMTPDIFNF